MKRRQLLLALGTTALGSSAITGSGAFTSVSANRSVEVAVAPDADAFLGLGPCDGSANGAYVTGAGDGVMTVELSASNGNVLGEGVNPESTTVFDDVFQIRNQGTQPVGVYVDVDPVQNGNGEDAVTFYRGGDQSTEIVGQGNVVCLDVGESVCVGFVVRTYGLDVGDSLVQPVSGGSELVVHADASLGCPP